MAEIYLDVGELPGRATDVADWVKRGDKVVLKVDGVPTFQLGAAGGERPEAVPPRERVLGLHPGSIQMSPDFNDELPPSFWSGEAP